MWGGETEEDRARLGFPPPAMMRRSVVAAAREGREYLGDTEPTAADLADAELLEAEILAEAADDPLQLDAPDPVGASERFDGPRPGGRRRASLSRAS
jgi:hypothetical protein